MNVRPAPALIAIVVTVAIGFAAVVLAYWYGMHERVASACNEAAPFVAARASAENVQEARGVTTSYGVADLPTLSRSFASPPQQGDALRKHLVGRNRVLLYSTDDYIRFVYLDGQGKAVGVECFVQ